LITFLLIIFIKIKSFIIKGGGCMKKLIGVLLLVSFLIIIFSCSGVNIIYAQTSNLTLTTADKDVASSSGIFGINLLKDINNSAADSNIFISPLSASTALGMTINGAKNSTYTQMKSALRLSGNSQDEINQAYLNLNNVLTNADSNVILTAANSIWCNQSIMFEQNFLDVNKKYFNSYVQNLDFANQASVGIINNWVSDNTKGKITKIISQISPYAEMYLINAIYFKAKWKHKFNSSFTKTTPFFLANGNTIQCAMMHKQDFFKYYKDKNYSALEIPYGNGNMNMLIILPDSSENVNQLLSRVDETMLNQLNAGFAYKEVNLHLPRFEINYNVSLNNSLKDLGMIDAFDSSAADFSGISKTMKLYISDVLQKTYIKVEEEGTEAAAVTSVGIIMTTSLNHESHIIVFNVDHPFIFLITEKNSGALLFAGKIVNPVK
jgi:serpin B